MLCIKNIQLAWNNHSYGNISATFYEGQISIITGNNGIGKTTLLYNLGLLNQIQGEYLYNDLSLKPKEYSSFRYHNIYYLLQEVSLYDDFILEDYLKFMSGNQNMKYDLDFPLHKKISQFSLGEKQYILMYGGFLANKNIYLLDEPTSALNKNLKLKVFDLLNKLKNKGKIIVIVSHDLELISLGDNIYELNNYELIQHKKSTITAKNITSYQKSNKFFIFKTRILSHAFRNILFAIILLSLSFTFIGALVTYQDSKTSNQIINSKRQQVIILSQEKPLLNNEFQIEPYYIYQYNKYTFINQALPLTLHSPQYLNINNRMIEYYEEDSIYYVKQVNSSFSKTQIGYLIHFNDPYTYSILMKQLNNQYSFKDIHSLYLEENQRFILENENILLKLLYKICLVIVIIIISFFYSRKTKFTHMNYILLLDLLGLSTKEKLMLFLLELILLLFLSAIILLYFHYEWFIVSTFSIFNYINICRFICKDFSHLYRNNI